MKKILIIFLIYTHLAFAGIPINDDYAGPSVQLLKRESWKKVAKKLKSLNINDDLCPYFEEIANLEDWGHIGYHGATQSYRIYQDIIRITLEEVLAVPIREDFHFLRIPGDTVLNLPTVKKFMSYWGEDKINNKSDKRAKQLLSLNYGLWSNYDNPGSFSLHLFVDNCSKSNINYQKQLEPFYSKLGISEKKLGDLFAIAKRYLNEESGILIQIAEHSHLSHPKNEAYTFADTQCYPCTRGGHRDGSSLISEHYQRILSLDYILKKKDVSPQLRLLCNNQNTLNPYSPLVIRRFDLYDKNLIKAYERELRDEIRSFDFDTDKVLDYREMLMELWLLDNRLSSYY